MANEAEILNNPTSTPAAVSTGYQRQNTNAVAVRVGVDKTVVSGGTGQCTLEISGPVDVNGVLYSIGTAVDFILSSADRYYIYLSGSGDNLTPTIDTDPGTFDADKNARYTAGGYRVLNWVIDYDGSDSVAYRWIEPSEDGNNFIENDLIVGNDLTVEGNVDIDGDIDSVVNVDASGNIVNDGYLDAGKGRVPTGFLYETSTTSNTIFDELAPSIPNVNDEILITGGFTYTSTYLFLMTCAKAVRADSTHIYIYGVSSRLDGSQNASRYYYSMTNGGSDVLTDVVLAW